MKKVTLKDILLEFYEDYYEADHTGGTGPYITYKRSIAKAIKAINKLKKSKGRA